MHLQHHYKLFDDRYISEDEDELKEVDEECEDLYGLQTSR